MYLYLLFKAIHIFQLFCLICKTHTETHTGSLQQEILILTNTPENFPGCVRLSQTIPNNPVIPRLCRFWLHTPYHPVPSCNMQTKRRLFAKCLHWKDGMRLLRFFVGGGRNRVRLFLFFRFFFHFEEIILYRNKDSKPFFGTSTF